MCEAYKFKGQPRELTKNMGVEGYTQFPKEDWDPDAEVMPARRDVHYPNRLHVEVIPAKTIDPYDDTVRFNLGIITDGDSASVVSGSPRKPRIGGSPRKGAEGSYKKTATIKELNMVTP